MSNNSMSGYKVGEQKRLTGVKSLERSSKLAVICWGGTPATTLRGFAGPLRPTCCLGGREGGDVQTFGRLWPRSCWEDSRTDLGATFRMLTGREIVAGSRSRHWDGMDEDDAWPFAWDGGNRPPMRRPRWTGQTNDKVGIPLWIKLSSPPQSLRFKRR